jgi:hypothetical protein
MIRKARPGDLPQVLALCERLRARIETYPNAPLDRNSIVHVFGRCISAATCLALVVVDNNERVTGLLLGVTQELWWSRAKEATDLILHAEQPGTGIALARRFVRWAWTVPRVAVVTLAQSSGLDDGRWGEALQAIGFRQIGGLYQLARSVALREEAA